MWYVLNPQGRVLKFFALPLEDRFLVSLKCTKVEGSNLIWADKMVLICRALWHWQNFKIFRGERTPLMQRKLFLFKCFEDASVVSGSWTNWGEVAHPSVGDVLM